MLHIDREINESVLIGGVILVTIKRVKGNRKVKLAIHAPKDVKIIRSESLTTSQIEDFENTVEIKNELISSMIKKLGKKE